MYKLILFLAVLFLTGLSGYAQCGKKVKWFASKAEFINSSGDVENSKEGTITVTTADNSILIEIAEAPDDILSGTVGEKECNWADAFKKGKSVFKINVVRGDGDSSDGTITVEGKDGKLIIELALEKMEGSKIRLAVDKYEVVE